MKAKEGILEALNAILTNELTAINQYFAHAAMARAWGYERLHKKFRDFSIEEMRDTEHIVDHILYLEGVPNMQRLNQVRLGENVLEHLQANLDLERQAVETLRQAIVQAAEVGDYTTRNLLEEMIRDEEGHVDWLETQLDTIRQLGLELYLSQHIHD